MARRVPKRRKRVLNPKVAMSNLLAHPPEWLDELGREEWHRAIDTLDELGLIAESDAPALGAYCDLYSRQLLLGQWQ